MLQEFLDFALKGNIMSLAIGFIIGGGFQKIVDSLVGDVIMPIIGLIMGDPNKFAELAIAGIPIGKFIQAVFNFMILAFILFMMVKGINAAGIPAAV